MTKVRTVFQPTQECEVHENHAQVLERQGYVWAGTDDELAEHYRAAGIDLPPNIKPTRAAATSAAGAQSKSTSEQAKGA